MAEEVKALIWSSNVQEDRHLEPPEERNTQNVTINEMHSVWYGAGEYFNIPDSQATDGCLFERVHHPGLCEWSWRGRRRPPSGGAENKAVFGCQSNLVTQVSNAFNIVYLLKSITELEGHKY